MDELTTPRDEWKAKYSSRLVARSDIDRDVANEWAETAAGEQVEAWGENVSEWEAPEDAADEEMSYWDNDEAQP